MGRIADQLKQIEEETTPMELIENMVDCIDLFYCEENNSRLSKELNNFSGIIHVLFKDARLLKSKLEKQTIITKESTQERLKQLEYWVNSATGDEYRNRQKLFYDLENTVDKYFEFQEYLKENGF